MAQKTLCKWTSLTNLEKFKCPTPAKMSPFSSCSHLDLILECVKLSKNRMLVCFVVEFSVYLKTSHQRVGETRDLLINCRGDVTCVKKQIFEPVRWLSS